MALEFAPVQSTQAVPIGAGSELIRLKYRHEDFPGEEARQQMTVGAAPHQKPTACQDLCQDLGCKVPNLSR